MPTITFERLSEDKKRLIEKAAIKEFSNYTYSDISINRIIHDIDMPRGSFYLYFENKEDLYLYVMDKYVTVYIESFALFVKKNNGDIILSFEYALNRVIDYCQNGESAMLVTKFLRGLTHRISAKTKEMNNKYIIDSVISNINKDYIKDCWNDKLFFIVDILANTLVHSLIEYLVMNIDIEKIRKKYYEQLKMIRNGVYK